MRAVVVVMLAVMGSGVAAVADEGDAILGVWQTLQQQGRFEITKNAAGIYEGRIIWIKQEVFPPDDREAGKPKHDRENPDPAKKGQPIIGLKFLDNFKYAGNNVWNNGTVYDPEHGKTYSCKMTLKSPNELEVRGYIGVSLLGRTEKWVKCTPEK